MLLCGMFLSCGKSPTKSEERPQVIVTEDITEDTVWESGKDYVIEDTLNVLPEALLIIEGDVVVTLLNKFSIINVYGDVLVSPGSAIPGVVFRSVGGVLKNNEKPYCFVAHEGSGVTLGASRFTSFFIAVKSVKGKLVVQGSVFEGCKTAVYCIQPDTCVIKSCLFNFNGDDVVLERGGDALGELTIDGNEFNETNGYGVLISNRIHGDIVGNQFNACEKGIVVTSESDVSIAANFFWGNVEAIRFQDTWGQGEVAFNSIDNAEVGVYLYRATPRINNNNILGCSQYGVFSYYNNNNIISAKNNWWGTLHEEEIREKIYDSGLPGARADAGIVVYVPYEKSPIVGEL